MKSEKADKKGTRHYFKCRRLHSDTFTILLSLNAWGRSRVWCARLADDEHRIINYTYSPKFTVYVHASWDDAAVTR